MPSEYVQSAALVEYVSHVPYALCFERLQSTAAT